MIDRQKSKLKQQQDLKRVRDKFGEEQVKRFSVNITLRFLLD